MSLTQAILQEFDNEAKTTRRVLERVPADKFEWQPHPKSMTLGYLALHTAMVPGFICGWACEDETKLTGSNGPSPVTTADLLAAHDKSVAKMRETMDQLGDAGLMKSWKAMAGEQTIFEMPKIALIRSIGRSIDARQAYYVSLMLEHRRRAIGDRTIEEQMKQLDEQGKELLALHAKGKR